MQASVHPVEDLEFIEALDADLEIPCDYDDGQHPWAVKDHGPVQWIGFASCPECQISAQRLLCTSCKDVVVHTNDGCFCGNCGARIIPFRRVFNRFEPYRKS